jgi:hypothetical protein
VWRSGEKSGSKKGWKKIIFQIHTVRDNTFHLFLLIIHIHAHSLACVGCEKILMSEESLMVKQEVFCVWYLIKKFILLVWCDVCVCVYSWYNSKTFLSIAFRCVCECGKFVWYMKLIRKMRKRRMRGVDGMFEFLTKLCCWLKSLWF